MILQSKMNTDGFFIQHSLEPKRISQKEIEATGKYYNWGDAREWLSNMPSNAWIKFDDIPKEIKFEVITLLEQDPKPSKLLKSFVNVIFCYDTNRFLITYRDDIEQAAIEIQRIYIPQPSYE